MRGLAYEPIGGSTMHKMNHAKGCEARLIGIIGLINYTAGGSEWPEAAEATSSALDGLCRPQSGESLRRRLRVLASFPAKTSQSEVVMHTNRRKSKPTEVKDAAG